jgi:phytoene dehydrogenase-like protein
LTSNGKALSEIDAIIVGAGHNGLTCAAYLAMAGLDVRVFERRSVVGGACVTEEFHPGFRNSTAAYTVGLLQPKIIRDLKLFENGLRVVERRVQNFLPLPDGRYLLNGGGRTEREIAKFSPKDAARYPAYRAQIHSVVELLRGLSLVAPPNLAMGDLRVIVRELSKFATLGKRLWQAKSLRAAFQLLHMSAGDMLDNWFESDSTRF